MSQPLLQSSHETPFSELIPYKTALSEAAFKFHPLYPLWDNKEKDEHPYRYYVAIIAAICVGMVSLFVIATQLCFIIYGNEPYTWISLGFFIIGQLCCCISYLNIIPKISGDYSDMTSFMSVVGCFFMPLCGILLPLVSLYQIQIQLERNEKINYYKLVLSTIPSATVAAFQAYPQILLLIAMISENNYQFDTLSILSLVASALSIITLSLQITSLFEQADLFLMNSLWLLFDCVLALCITSVIFYDNITLTIFYIDVGLYAIWVIIIMIMFAIFKTSGCCDELCRDMGCNIWVGLCCLPLICLVLLVIFTGIFALYMTMACIAFAIAAPVIIYFHLFTLIWFFVMDHIYEWNICPISFRSDDVTQRNRYLCFQWVTAGNNMEEKNDRLYSINMVILDNDQTLKTKYSKLCDDIVKNIKSSITSNQQSVHHMTTVIDEFFIPKFENETIEMLSEKLGVASCMLKMVLIYFPINRMLHCIVPLVIIVYVAWSVQWNIFEIHLFLKILFGVWLILFILCIIGIYVQWRTWYYHRLILPTNRKSWLSSEKDWNTFGSYVANCYYYIIVFKVIVDWCESNSGDKYIGYIIMNFCGIGPVDDKMKMILNHKEGELKLGRNLMSGIFDQFKSAINHQ
eukprot:72235_1